jgi:hypothetical protein
VRLIYQLPDIFFEGQQKAFAGFLLDEGNKNKDSTKLYKPLKNKERKPLYLSH